MNAPRIYCSEAAAGDGMAGSADPVDVWLLLEYRPAWTAKAITDNELGEPVQRWLADQVSTWQARGLKARPQFIRQPQRTSDGVVLFVAERSGLQRFDLPDYDALTELDVAGRSAAKIAAKIADTHRSQDTQDRDTHRSGRGIADTQESRMGGIADTQESKPRIGRIQDTQQSHGEDARIADTHVSVGHPVTDTHYFVCTNGQRDVCCARFGLPTHAALATAVGERAWQTTHVGGHRFAPNVLALPQGALYGRVRPADVPAFVAQVEGGLAFDWLRGVSYDPGAVQAARVLGRVEPAISGESKRLGEDRWEVQFANGAVLTVELEPERLALASCNDAPKAVRGWRGVDQSMR
jgi:hypothetical protein